MVAHYYKGRDFSVEVADDGTGVIRDHRRQGQPTAITSAATKNIKDTLETTVDDLAGKAVLDPAPWNTRSV